MHAVSDGQQTCRSPQPRDMESSTSSQKKSDTISPINNSRSTSNNVTETILSPLGQFLVSLCRTRRRISIAAAIANGALLPQPHCASARACAHTRAHTHFRIPSHHHVTYFNRQSYEALPATAMAAPRTTRSDSSTSGVVHCVSMSCATFRHV